VKQIPLWQIKENVQLLGELTRFREMASAPPPPDVDFDFIVSPHQEATYTADIQIHLTGNTPLKQAKLDVNGAVVTSWQIPGNARSFRTPLIEAYTFDRPDNQLMVEAENLTGRVFPKTHQHKFPLAQPPWTPRIIAFATYTLLALGSDGAEGGEGAARDLDANELTVVSEMRTLADKWKEVETKREEGREEVAKLEKRFEPWYYVIDAKSFDKLQVQRADLVTAPEAGPPAPGEGGQVGDGDGDGDGEAGEVRDGGGGEAGEQGSSGG